MELRGKTDPLKQQFGFRLRVSCSSCRSCASSSGVLKQCLSGVLQKTYYEDVHRSPDQTERSPASSLPPSSPVQCTQGRRAAALSPGSGSAARPADSADLYESLQLASKPWQSAALARGDSNALTFEATNSWMPSSDPALLPKDSKTSSQVPKVPVEGHTRALRALPARCPGTRMKRDAVPGTATAPAAPQMHSLSCQS